MTVTETMTPKSEADPNLRAPVSTWVGGGAGDRSAWRRDLREIVADLWNYRDLLVQLTLRDVRIRYKQTLMGFGWAVFMPAMIVLSGLIVRSAMAFLSGGGLEASDVAGVATKAVPWAFVVGSIGFANLSLVGNLDLVTKIYFPREVLPLSATLASAFDAIVSAVAVAGALAFLGVSVTATVLWVPLLGLVLFALVAAAALILSCANVFFRDVKYIVQILLTFGIFFTPVFFEPSMFGPLGARVMMVNPLAPVIEGLRLAVVEGWHLSRTLTLIQGGAEVVVWSPYYLVYSGVVALVSLIGGSILFHRLEFLFAEYV